MLVSACGIGPAPLPTATADVGATHVSLPRGSYCWSSAGQGTCADAADPDTLFRSGYLKPITAAPGTIANVAFSSKPSTVDHVLVWVANGGGNATSTPGASFQLGAQPGRYLYAITGYWHEGDVSFFLPVDITG